MRYEGDMKTKTEKKISDSVNKYLKKSYFPFTEYTLI